MKKALTLLSVTLSLVLIAATIFVVPTFAASGSTIGENLLANPELNYTDNGDGTYTIEGWTIPSNIEYKRTSRVYTDTDGKTVIEMQSTDIDTAANFATATANKQTYMLDANKNYKFTALVKIEAPDMAKDSTGATATFNHNTGYYGAYIYYQVGNSDNYRSAKRIYTSPSNSWEEYSFIIKGSDITQGQWQYFWGVKMYGMRAKISIKSPCVAEYNGDTLTVQEKVEPTNLLPDGLSWMQHNINSEAYASHENTTVELNGEENVPAIKLTTNNEYITYFSTIWLKHDSVGTRLSLNADKKYKFSAWVKMDKTDYNQWAPYGIYVGFCNGNDEWATKSEYCKTFGEWQKLECIIDVDSFQWQYRVGVGFTAIAGDLYIADIRLEEFVGDITVSEQNAAPQNIVTNGDFETYDASVGRFAGWSYFNGNNAQNVMSCGEGINGNAYKFTSVDTNGCPTATQTISIDNSLDYKASVMVKVENSSATNNFGYASWGGGIRMIIKGDSNTFTTQTEALSAVTDGWVKLSVNVTDIPSNTGSIIITLGIGATKADVYFDDVLITPMTGGTLNIDRTNANTGDTVYLSAVADEGYYLDSISYNDGTTDTAITETVSDVVCATVSSTYNTYSQIASDCIYQFAMPAENITVKAVFKEIIIGDINGDEVLDIRDLVRLTQYLDDNTTVIAEVNADVDGNGAIEVTDVTALRETLLNQ